MADELLRSKHAFGTLENIQNAIDEGKIDAFDILFVKDSKGNPYVGWIDREGKPVIVDNDCVVNVTTLPESGEPGKIYIYDNRFYYWDGTTFTSPADMQGVSEEVVDAKISAAVNSVNNYTDEKVESALSEINRFYEKVEYEIAYKPEGTLVDYRDKEIRVMCPVDTEWEFQQSGEGSDANSYYIGFKAYAPENANSFKEDSAESITDNTMYYFEGNDFAGVDSDGRKYSIVWLPVAVNENGVWTYYGSKSTEDHYIGWYYSVEWYDLNGELIASDCIRINLSNEECHSAIEPFYIGSAMDKKVNEAIKNANMYTDEQINNIIESIAIVEF